LRVASNAELLSQLLVTDAEVGLKIWALQLAADRSLREAVPAGIAALSDRDEDVQAAAVALLVELGDERAISALSKGIDFKDHQQLRVVMEAVSAIGGEDAVEFLEYVASGHPDEDMRARAKESIGQARRNRAVP
jgi:HEAT repeat protein